MATPVTSVDAYLEQLDGSSKRVVSQLRELVRAAAPEGEECISYGMPAIRVDGQMIVAYAAAKAHFALHVGKHPIERHRAALAGYDTSKGTVRFPRGTPIPDALVTTLVATRVSERAARSTRKR